MPERVLLTSTTNSFEAKVIKAHLAAEGIDSELRGAVDGPYPFMLGGMAEVGVWVPPDQLENAQLVMLATEIDASVDSAAGERPAWTWSGVVGVALVLVMLAVVTVARLLQLG